MFTHNLWAQAPIQMQILQFIPLAQQQIQHLQQQVQQLKHQWFYAFSIKSLSACLPEAIYISIAIEP